MTALISGRPIWAAEYRNRLAGHRAACRRPRYAGSCRGQIAVSARDNAARKTVTTVN
jgi:hypothetical protein